MMMEKKKGKKTLCAAFQFMITNEISHSQAWGLPFFFLISFLTAAFGMRNRSRSITATPGRLAALYHENSF